MDNEKTNTTSDGNNKVLEEGTKEEIFGSIKGREIDHIVYDRWMGGARWPEKIVFKDGSAVMFKCDIRHYWMAQNPDTPIREAIAYQIDRIIGLGLVPKTQVIDDTINNVRYDGSIQEWVSNAKDGYAIEQFSPDEKRDYDRLRIFDFVIGNSDRHLGNILFTSDGKLHAIDHNASLIISAEDDILSFSDVIINFFCRNVVSDMPHVVDIIERFYESKDKILRLIDTYIQDNKDLAKLMVESRILYLYKTLKKDSPFSRKYREWRNGLDVEIQEILKKKNK